MKAALLTKSSRVMDADYSMGIKHCAQTQGAFGGFQTFFLLQFGLVVLECVISWGKSRQEGEQKCLTAGESLEIHPTST